MFRLIHRSFFLSITGALLVTLGLSACNAPMQPPAPAATQPIIVLSTATAVPTSIATMINKPTTASSPTAAGSTQPPANSTAEGAPAVTVDLDGVAQAAVTQVVAAVAPSTSDPVSPMPQYMLLDLQGYPITNSLKKPQIFVFPVKDLAVNQKAANAARDLQTLLQAQQTGDQLPYLPLAFSSRQALHPQVKYLDFKNGKGVRYLTEWHNGLSPIDNQGLIYTFQALTSDGKYYVAAVLPANLEGLPADKNDTSRQPTDYLSNYSQYLADTISLLEQNPASAYTPDLDKLDALVQSIEVR